MKRGIAMILAAILLAACESRSPSTHAGYVEADYVMIASEEAGRVSALHVREGDRLAKGDAVASLDASRLAFAARQSEAQASAVARRSEEAGVLQQQVREAEAELERARLQLRRSSALAQDGYAAQARVDADKAAYDAGLARVKRARAELEAAKNEESAAQAGALLAQRRLSDLALVAPVSGVVERIYRRPGEVVAPGEPVAALLSPDNLKLRFFAPQAELPRLELGAEIAFSCDGCDTVRKAKISFIATEPQFTPPVIYSLSERSKLVFLVEARPLNPAGLHPGLPIDVSAP